MKRTGLDLVRRQAADPDVREDKAAMQSKIDADVARFKAAGGKVKMVEIGVSNDSSYLKLLGSKGKMRKRSTQ